MFASEWECVCVGCSCSRTKPGQTETKSPTKVQESRGQLINKEVEQRPKIWVITAAAATATASAHNKLCQEEEGRRKTYRCLYFLEFKLTASIRQKKARGKERERKAEFNSTIQLNNTVFAHLCVRNHDQRIKNKKKAKTKINIRMGSSRQLKAAVPNWTLRNGPAHRAFANSPPVLQLIKCKLAQLWKREEKKRGGKREDRTYGP